MKKRKNRYGACHYCICTVCTRSECPWSHLANRECSSCRERAENVARLDCDYFCHYLKTKRFRFKKRSKPLPEHFGTYVLKTPTDVFIGSYEHLEPLQKRFGGELKRLNLIDYHFGGLGESGR